MSSCIIIKKWNWEIKKKILNQGLVYILFALQLKNLKEIGKLKKFFLLKTWKIWQHCSFWSSNDWLETSRLLAICHSPHPSQLSHWSRGCQLTSSWHLHGFTGGKELFSFILTCHKTKKNEYMNSIRHFQKNDREHISSCKLKWFLCVCKQSISVQFYL